MEDLFPGAKVKMAYGSACEHMKPGGKGELSVPTTGTYKAAKRAFGKDVDTTDEFRTTLMEWETGRKKEAVFRLPSPQRSSQGLLLGQVKPIHEMTRLGHTTAKTMPVVLLPHRAKVEQYLALQAERNKRRRGGQPFNAMGAPEERGSNVLRYPEVRGLRFSPEKRMYLDRDLQSALAIARLRTTELLGLLRPAPFHRSVRLQDEEGGKNICMQSSPIDTVSNGT